MAMRVAMRAPAAVERTLCECETTFVCDFDPHTLREQLLCDRRVVAARKYAKLCMQEPSDRSLEESHYDCLNFVCGFFCAVCVSPRNVRGPSSPERTHKQPAAARLPHTHNIAPATRTRENGGSRSHTQYTMRERTRRRILCNNRRRTRSPNIYF